MNWKHYSSVILLFLACVFFILPTPSGAQTDVVYASYKYVMGDNDTKNDAKHLCFLEAKRRCLEKVGTYVESLTEVKNYNLTKDEIRSYTSAIVQVEVVSEEIAFEGESIVIYTRVKAEIEADHTRKELQRISQDKALQARIKEQQNQIETLEQKITRLQNELSTASYESSLQLRKQRSTSFESIDVANEKIRNVLLAKRKREAERKKLVEEISRQEARKAKAVRTILQYLEIGMTTEEVGQIIKAITGDVNSPAYVGTGGMWYWDKLVFLFGTDEVTGDSFLFKVRYDSKACQWVTLKTESYDVLKSKAGKEKALSICPELQKYLWAEE